MNLWVPRQLFDSIRPERVQAIEAFGWSERQARFLLHVLVHSGVFLERQYHAFTGIAHGQKTHDFLRRLVDQGYATAMTPGRLHCGRLYHVRYKPLYEAIGEPDNRNRRPAATGRLVERLMLLDVVLKGRDYTWLGTEQDKLAYFRARELCDRKCDPLFFPNVKFKSTNGTTVRYFPDKLPIGIERALVSRRHVFVYLVRSTDPMEFRLFLLQRVRLLLALDEWTLRIVVPRVFRKAASLYRWALRDELLEGMSYSDEKVFNWYLHKLHGRDTTWVERPEYADYDKAARKFSTRRFQALHRMWLRTGSFGNGAATASLLQEKLQRGWGRIEFMELPHQYLQLTNLVGVA